MPCWALQQFLALSVHEQIVPAVSPWQRPQNEWTEPKQFPSFGWSGQFCPRDKRIRIYWSGGICVTDSWDGLGSHRGAGMGKCSPANSSRRETQARKWDLSPWSHQECVTRCVLWFQRLWCFPFGNISTQWWIITYSFFPSLTAPVSVSPDDVAFSNSWLRSWFIPSSFLFFIFWE